MARSRLHSRTWAVTCTLLVASAAAMSPHSTASMQTEKAINSLDEVLEQSNDGRSLLHLQLATLGYRLSVNQNQRADNALRKAIRACAEPNSLDEIVSLIDANILLGEMDAARAAFDAVSNVKLGSVADSSVARAICLLRMGQTSAALAEIERTNTNSPTPFIKLAVFAAVSGQPADAEPLLALAEKQMAKAKQDDAFHEATIACSISALKLGRTEVAERVQRSIVDPYEQRSAQTAVIRWAARNGFSTEVRRSFDASIDKIVAGERTSQPGALESLLRLAVQTGAKEPATRILSIAEDTLDGRFDPRPAVFAAGVVGNIQQIERFLQQVVSQPAADKPKAENELWVAASYAAAGDLKESELWLEKSTRTFPRERMISEAYVALLQGFCHSGNEERALALANQTAERRLFPAIARQSVQLACVRGDYVRAWNLAEKHIADPTERSNAWVMIAAYAGRHQKTEDITGLIDAVVDPELRLLLRLRVLTAERGMPENPIWDQWQFE